MTSRTYKILRTMTVAVFAAGALLTPTIASAVDFSGKTVTAIVPFKEGGGADTVTRLFAPYFSKHLPGKPTVIVRNMPGGATTRGNNWFHGSAKADGSTYIAVSTSSQTTFTLGGKKVKYDMTKWKYVLAIPQGTVVYARPETGVKGKNLRDDITALRSAKLVTGAKSPTSAELRLFLGLEMLGVKNVKPVFGLSTGNQRKSMLRGELNINYDSATAYLRKAKKYSDKGTFVPVFTLGYTENGKIVRDPAYPELPTLIEAYKTMNGGKMPSGIIWNAYKNFYSMGVMTSKGFALPQGASKEVHDAYVKAAQAISNDETFKKDAGKRLGVYPILLGDAAKKVFTDAVDVSPEVKAYMKDFIKKNFDVNI